MINADEIEEHINLLGIGKLEELCTKFLQYRIDSRNLIHFLRNTIKYDTSDLRDVVISRLLKDAEKAFENEQMMEPCLSYLT